MSLNLTIKFGIVSTPVKLEAGPRAPEDLSFRQLAPDGGPCEQRLVSKATGNIVQRSDLRKGVEIGPDTFVVVPEEEIKALSPVSDQCIHLKEFVAADKLDPLCFKEAHYLKPADAGIHAYNLIYSALKRTGKVGIGRAVLYRAETAIALRAGQYGLVLHALYFADELRSMREFRPDLSGVSEAESALAVQLIEAMSVPEFDIAKYPNTHAAKVRQLIASKTPTPAGVLQMPAAQPDIMSAMQASLDFLRGPGSVTEMPKPLGSKRRRARREAVSA